MGIWVDVGSVSVSVFCTLQSNSSGVYLKHPNPEKKQYHTSTACFARLFHSFHSQDPWERELVEVRDSLLDQAGQGLFAR